MRLVSRNRFHHSRALPAAIRKDERDKGESEDRIAAGRTRRSPTPAPNRLASPPAPSTTPFVGLVTRHLSHVTFLCSLHGISHNKIEDTKEEHLAMGVKAFDALADKTLRWIER